MEQEAYRHVPYDIDVEQALLGAILADNRAMERASALVKPEHFYDPLHGRIFETMSQMIERSGVVVPPLTLHATMKADPGVIETGGQAYFDALRNAAPAIPSIKDFANILTDLAIRRSLLRIGEDIVNTAYDAPTEKNSKEQIAEAEKALYAVAETNKYGEGALDFHQALTQTVQAAERAAARGGRISGVTSGFTDIDNLLGGLQPSDLLLLAGRAGMGKTALGTNMGFHAARTYVQDMAAGAEMPRGAPVLFFSLEMAAQQLSARILSEQAELEMWKIRNGKFTDTEWEKFVLSM